MTILAVDSSAVTASAALVCGGTVVGESFLHTGLTHSDTLLPMVQALLKQTNRAIDAVDAFAVTTGPGSFTGIRIGIATVKGLAMATNKPCCGISTLEAIANAFCGIDCFVYSVMDARREQVYGALFRSTAEGTLQRVTQDDALPITELPALLPQACSYPVYFAGDGAQLCFDTLRNTLPQARLAPFGLRFQRASAAALLAQDGRALQTAKELQPVYLRLSQAERELKKKQNTD